MEEVSFRGHVNLRGNPHAEGFSNAFQRCLGVSLPLEANTVADNGSVTALWLGPDEWLLVTLPGKETELIRTLRDALRDVFIAVTDVTDGQTILRVSGPHAADVLRQAAAWIFIATFSAPAAARELILTRSASRSAALIRRPCSI